MSSPYRSWGRYPDHPPAQVVVLRDRPVELPSAPAPMLAYGLGRSYGDSCQNGGGTLLVTRGLDRFIAFDPERGVLRCESGVSLDAILQLAVPQGWFLPVVPGTRFVTVGGAIANDVHGKNHHRAGSFSRHVLAFELLRSDGRLQCSRTENAALFAATIGGLGLTGLITRVDLQLERVPGPWMQVETLRFAGLEEFFALSAASARSHAYSVAWIDCLARDRAFGRGLFTRADFIATDRPSPRMRGPALPVPFTPPLPLVGGPGTRWFNRAWYYWPRRQIDVQPYARFLFPLDGLSHWNRLYGPRGFLQHQCVLPPECDREALSEILSAIVHAGTGSFLAVLKRFGDFTSEGLLGFPRPGTTLALDFPNRGADTLDLLARLDDIVAAAGGAVYPAKDARMSSTHFRRFFPRWREFSQHIDPAFSSSFWRRVTADDGEAD